MKNTLLSLALFAGAVPAMWAQAFQPDTPITEIIFIPPAGIRGGTLAPYARQSDNVDAQATCEPAGPFAEVIGGGISVRNNAPACGALSYVINTYTQSARSDGQYDHLVQTGISYYPTGTPEDAEWVEACTLDGTNFATGQPNGIWGTPYLVYHNPGTCAAAGMTTQ